MKLSEFEFGFADATKEYTRVPIIFEKAFVDKRNFIDKLLKSYEFLLVGRKGVGKSAFSSKIRYLSEKSSSLYAFPLNLSDFEFTTFAKTGVDDMVVGTQKYKSSWDFLLMLTIFKILYNEMGMTEIEEITDIMYMIDAMGFSTDIGYKSDVSKLAKIKIGVGVTQFDLEFEKTFNTKPVTYIERISIISEEMQKVISKLYLNERKIVIVIDGLDDILRYKRNKIEIISSLIRSADYINDKMLQSGVSIKILIMIREDLISMVNDPDINKIVQDSSLFLNWSDRTNELKELVDLRFGLSGLSKSQAKQCWDKIFPSKIRSKKSWDYILEYTLYKPRDILRFMKYCQTEYPDQETLSLSQTQNVLKIYSNRYFIEEMKNELSGIIDDELINALPSAFRKLGGRSFRIHEINNFINQSSLRKKISIDETKILLMYLFEAGYVGQLIDNRNGGKKSVVFKYRNQTARIDYYQSFLIHRGLHSGLGVRT